jgi:hypothetical protein
MRRQGMGGRSAGAGFDPLKIAGLADSDTKAFGWNVHVDEYHVCRKEDLFYRAVDRRSLLPCQLSTISFDKPNNSQY